MLMAWRGSCLGPAKVASPVFLVLFKNGGRKVSPRFHLLFLMFIKGMNLTQ